MKMIGIVTLFLAVFLTAGCMNGNRKNKVHIEQINPDNSYNWRYIFREEIEEERKQEKARKDDIFQ